MNKVARLLFKLKENLKEKNLKETKFETKAVSL
jgi:hypothetical protein